MSKHKSKFDDDDKTVIIKPEAYYKMLLHILRFGNKVKDSRQYKEVMGMLIGRLEGEGNIKNVIVEEAIPISHGGSIEVDFAPEDYVSFSLVDAEYAEKNLFTVGWYHSHPSLKIFFSGTDVKNQLGWQTPNPSAIGIVFDHTYLENSGDLGFRTFRLDDPSKITKTHYHEVKTVVETPDKLDYYFKLMKLINCIHSKEPPILEINETSDIFGEIFFPSETHLLTVKPELDLTEIFSALQSGLTKFLELSINPLINFLNDWSQQIIKGIIDNNLQMRSDLMNIKNTLSQGIDNLQNNFKFSLSEKLTSLDIYIDDRLEDFDKDREAIKSLINQLKDDINIQINKLFEEKINISINESLKIFDENLNKLTEINQRKGQHTEKLESQQGVLENLSGQINSLKSVTSEKLKESLRNIKEPLEEKINSMKNNLNGFQNEIDALNSSYNSSISQLVNLGQSLNSKFKEITDQKEQLLNKIQELEEGGSEQNV